MQETMIALVNDHGYWGIAFLLWIETVFPPIPSEAVLLCGGFLTTITELTPWRVVVYATLGSTVGALLLYTLGRALGRERLRTLMAGRCGKVLHLSVKDVDKADAWFVKYQARAVFIGRCVPVVRSLISIPAGMAEMNPGLFLGLTVAGNLMWNTLLVWVGRLAGDTWEQSLRYLDWYSKGVLAVLAVVALGAVIVLWKRRRGVTKD